MTYRNDLNYPKPSNDQKPHEKAFSIFVEWAQRNNRNYFGDMVKDNLNASLTCGRTPQQAVEDLIKRAP